MAFSSDCLILLLVLVVSVFASIGYLINVYRAVRQLPRIEITENDAPVGRQFPKTSIIIPAFNEEENIQDCVESILTSTQLSAEQLEVWVIDDQSTDGTAEILQALQLQLTDSRLKLLSGLPRPKHQQWTGKNWACHQGAEQANGEFLLFLDADVRLQPHAVIAAVRTAVTRQLDLLTCISTIVCGSLIEWLVQPLMFINVLVTFNSKVVKDPHTKTSYALGPFLLFRASTYQKLGGHKAVAGYVAEDVAFARAVKHNGFKIQQVLGTQLASVRMYRNWPSLWEGWTKVLYVGAQRNKLVMLLLVMVMLLVYTVPWIGLVLSTYHLLTHAIPVCFITLGLSGLAILLQYWIRRQGSHAIATSTKYWWLQSVGGLLIAVFAIVSIIKTETGYGWTWRGRKLTPVK